MPFRTLEVSDPRFETEGLRYLTVKSKALRRRGDVTLFVPDAPSGSVRPLLLLLHGVYGSHWCWTRKAGVHRIAQQMIRMRMIEPLVIAMPSDGLWGDGSGYVPHRLEDAERWIVEEVVEASQRVAAQLNGMPKLFIAGLSMGGYGALRIGAKYASRFSGISAHSSINAIEQIASFAEEPLERYAHCASAEDLDPLYWMNRNRDALPPLRFDCGTADHLLEANRQFHSRLAELSVPHEYVEFPGGHDWSYWQAHARDTLLFVSRHTAT